MKTLKFHSVTFGADPEFFFKKKTGGVVAAEKVLPPQGLKCPPKDDSVGGITAVGEKTSAVIIDGVQAELNPRANTCRANLGYEIASCLRQLRDECLSDDVSADFSQSISLSKRELSSLSDKYKKFGCSPSLNVYSSGGVSHITVNPLVYRKRSAGGHIHLGLPPFGDNEMSKALKRPNILVPMLDLIVGNTCVLIDRDIGNIARREVYGKAGEHRIPSYGVEYRTPSNFWLKSYPLMGLVMGLARQATIIVANSGDDNELVREVFGRVKMKHVVEAINTNDYELALFNFDQIIELLLEITPLNDNYPIHKGNIKQFRHFVKKGVDHWFKGDPMGHWATLSIGNSSGFESFLKSAVRADMVGVNS